MYATRAGYKLEWHYHDGKAAPSMSPKNARMAKRAPVEWLAAHGVKKNLFLKKKTMKRFFLKKIKS
jgi:hypothetical protein